MPLERDNMFFGFAPKFTNEQRIYVNSIFDNRVTIVDAIAGSGKTTLAVGAAKILGMDLIYVHPAVEEDRLGFTPGSEEEKLAKYHQPLRDALYEIGEDPSRVIFSKDDMNGAKSGRVWVYPMSDIFLRGTNLKGNKFVLIDEAQNFTYAQLRKILTRISDDCKVVIVGHVEQCDLPDPTQSGFIPYLNYLSHKSYVQVCRLSKNFRGELATDADVPYDELLKYTRRTIA